jgi:hypothetical protein
MHCRLLTLCLLCSGAVAAPVQVDAFASSSRRLPLLTPVEPGLVSSIEPRLGVPSFFWAPRAASPMRSLADQGVTAQQAALRHLFAWAPLYGMAGPQLVEAARLVRLHDLGRGAIIASFEQRERGLPVFRQRLTVIMNQQLELIALSGHFTPSVARASFKLGGETAFSAAVTELTGRLLEPSRVRATQLDDAGFQQFSVELPGLRVGEVARAKQVLFDDARELVPAWYIELEAGAPQTTDATLTAFVISAVDGQLLSRHEMTEAEAFTYRVWADPAPSWLPWDGPFGTEVTPHPTSTPSTPFNPPWLAGALRTLQNAPFSRNDAWLPAGASELKGNNAEAYADLVGPDGFSAGDLRAVPSSAATFDYAYDPAQHAHASSSQRMAGLTQLFYDLNFLHDWFYDHGFDEAAGNAQTENLMRGGAGGDSLRGEAQDNGGTNNANMSTPADGARPRMQMYLWDVQPPPTTTALGLGASWLSGPAAFGPQSFSLTGTAVLAVDGAGSTSDACSALINNVAGKIVVVDRGTCALAVKAQNVQQASGLAVLIINDVAGAAPAMGATAGVTITIPSLSLSQVDGAALKAALGGGPLSVTLDRQPALTRDGDLDNTIVAHEWGHYLSNRLIADGTGLGLTQARGMGEGWSDFVAMLMMVREADAAIGSNANWGGTWGVASYALGTGSSFYFGLRRYPYSIDFTKNPLTFRHIQDGNALPAGVPIQPNGTENSEVHSSGEVWATMLWEGSVSLVTAPRFTFAQARDRLKDYLVASLKATPPNPTFIEARDAWLAVAAATDPRDYASLGAAFARRGMGRLAVAPDRASTTNTPVVEDFALGNDLVFVKAELDDENQYCDRDGVLDVGERGRLRLTFRNVGFANLQASTATITTTTPGVSITPTTVALTPSTPQGVATGVAEVVVTGLGAPSQIDLRLAWADPALSASPTPRSIVVGYRVQTDVLTASSATDDFEATPSAWASQKDPAHSTRYDWSRQAVTPMQHVFAGNAATTADLWLLSPPLTVHASQPLVLTLVHRWAFEASGGVNYDGAVIELSSDDGVTWSDVGSAAGYVGTITGTDSDNPLLGRQAYVGRSAGYPAFITTSVNLGTAFAGRTVRVRFRLGVDQSVNDLGWELDRVAFAGITNTPFATLVADASRCVNRRPVANAGPDLTAEERTVVTLESSRSTDPDGNPLTARWAQRSGPAVTLSGATFTAPDVGADLDLSFDLVVNDGALDSTPDPLLVHVRNVNRAPTADGGTFTVEERSTATLEVLGSDVDGDALTWRWTQLSGPAIAGLSTTAQLTFTAPEVSAAQGRRRPESRGVPGDCQ